MAYADLIQNLGFTPKENSAGIFRKDYTFGHFIEVDFDHERINYGRFISSDKKTTQNFSQAENWVVLECVDRLLEKGYSPKNITLEKVYPSGHGTSGRLDILVNRDDGTAYLMIECKTYGDEFEKAAKRLLKDGGQLFTYFQQDKNSAILMLYSSALIKNEIVYKNEVVKIEDDYRQTGNVKDFYDRWNKLPKNNGVFDEWVNAYDFQSKALTPKGLKDITQEDSSFIFNQFLEILRHNVVSDKPNAFNKIFTLFLCKIYDEKATKPTDELEFQWLEGKDDHISFQKRLTDLYRKGMKEFLEKEVTDLSDKDFEDKFGDIDESVKQLLLKEFTKIRLKKNNEFAIKEVFDEDSFEENAKVVKEVVELLQGFKIRYTKKQQYLSDFFELLLTTGLKQESGQFFTPVPIAQFIIKSLPIDQMLHEKLTRGETNNLLPNVIDYAAGSGHFLTESMHEIQRIINNTDSTQFVKDTQNEIDSWKIKHFNWAYTYIYGIEKDYRLVKVGKVGCYLHGDGLAKIVHSDGLGSFAKNEDYKDLLKKIDNDFPQENKQFDICVSNPPYSVSAFKNNARKYYTEEDFGIYDKLTDQSSEIECLFIERTKQLLKDGGIAGIILPSSILSNTGIYTKAREIILQYFDIVAIAELGSNTFMATGTNTVTLFLRRRNNYESINIRKSIEKAIADAKDVTINGIEKSFGKYVTHVWEGISFADYATLLKKQPNEAIENHEIYQEYQKKITAGNDAEKWNKIIEIETEKLFYFLLAYKQKIVLVKSGEKQDEKQFLGYEFSNRRGSEGIHPIRRGKAIDECTQLFDADVFDNPEKASTYIYHAFNGDFETPINEKLSKHITRQNLVDMFTFDRVDFEKGISLAVKKKEIESKWKAEKLENISILLKRGKSAKYGNSTIQIIKSGQARGFKEFDFLEKHFVDSTFILDERQLKKGDILINSSGVGTAGRVTLFDVDGVFVVDSHITILRPNQDLVLPNFVLQSLARIGFKNIEAMALGQSGQIELTLTDIKNIKIPLPPKDVQEKIVAEIEVLEAKEAEAKAEIEANKKLITYCFANLAFDEQNLGNIAAFKNGLNYSRSSVGDSIKIVGVKDFQDNFSPVLSSLEETQIDGNLSDDFVLKPKDILVVRSNGSANLVGRFLFIDKLTDKTSFSGFTIRIRPINSDVDAKFLCYFLRTDIVRNKIISESGGSNIKSLNQTLLSSIQIPLPPLAEQQKIVSQITEIENKIAALESEISAIPQQKESILKKYL